MFRFCFFRTFAPIFYFQLCSFCWRGKNVSCRRTQGTLATPLFSPIIISHHPLFYVLYEGEEGERERECVLFLIILIIFTN